MTDRDGISAGDLRAGYGMEEIVKSVTCSFGGGSFTGIIGPNGSGKTTLLKAFSRAIPSAGLLELDGRAVSAYTPAELGRALGFVPQDEARPFPYTVLEAVLMARYARTSRFASLAEADYARCRRALDETGIAHLAGRSIRSLSGGEWQRVLIARALAQDARVLLLDEPTSHLDLSHQSGILRLMQRLARDGATIIGVFHDLNQAALYCDRLVMVKGGRIVSDGSPAEVLTPERIRDVYGADVVASFHPATGRTFLVPVGQCNGTAVPCGERPVLVISGGGSGTPLMHFLKNRGYSLAAGVLATTDTDYQTACALAIPCIATLPFSRIPAHSLHRLATLVGKADRIVLSAHPVGTGNLPVLEALAQAVPARVIIHCGKGQEFASYDYAQGAAAAAYEHLCAAGARSTDSYDGILAFLQAGRPPATKGHDP